MIEFMVESRPPPRKRRRVVISCFECHRRKQKCDRELPCGNCIARNRESSCSYEAGAPTVKSSHDGAAAAADSAGAPLATRKGVNGRRDGGGGGGGGGGDDDVTLSTMAAALGYSQSRPSTLSLLRTIETADSNDGAAAAATAAATTRYIPSHHDSSPEMREKYKGLVRQLPAKTYVDRLVGMYFRDLHHQYSFLDRAVFAAQLGEWNRLPLPLLSSPEALRPAMRFFPALLFQILAASLLLLPPGTPDPVFDPLKYAGGMTFEDLATDYSESGSAIVNLFGKSALDEVTVQAQFIRSLFLKYTAHVIECWHSIAAAIRDAQELGMHRDSLDPKPADSSVESILQNQWRIQHRRKMYMMLIAWDVNMAVFLGRPGSVVLANGLPSLPIDAPTPADISKTPIELRDEAVCPPTLLTRQLMLYKVADALRYILDLEPDGSHPKDFSKVDRVHQIMLTLEDTKPAVFRLENADRRWDDHPDCSGWIHTTRLYLKQLHNFGLMALHRPYIFHRRESRDAALRAAVNMLGIQRQTFDGLPLVQWRGFHLFFGSFDAVVVIASIFILFPHENPGLRDSAVRRFHWTIAKFDEIREHNSVARAAQGVLAAIQSRFIKAVGKETPAEPSPASEPSSVSPSHTAAAAAKGQMTGDTPGSGPPTVTSSNSGGGGGGGYTRAGSGGGTSDGSTNSLSLGISPSDGSSGRVEPPWGNGGGGGMNAWSLPDESLSLLAPIYPTSDLFFNDLVAKYGDVGGLESCTMPEIGAQQAPSDGISTPFQFDGDFAADNTFWQFMNQFNPDLTG